MNKNQLIKSVSKRTKLTQKDCALCLGALRNIVEEALCHGEAVTVSGFGRFVTKYKAERKGIHPLTRQLVMFPSKYVPTFCPSGVFKAKFR